MAQEAYCSVRQWLVMKEEDITTKSLKRFRRYILDKENPPQDRAPPSAAASSSSSGPKDDAGWTDDALLVEALASFERQAAGGKKKSKKKSQDKKGPSSSSTEARRLDYSTVSSPDVEHQRTSDVAGADVAGADVAGAALQPCLGTATSPEDAVHPVSVSVICKKLSGDGRGTAEWCTNVAKELGQILTSVLTCEESLEKLRLLAEGLMERYRRAGEAPPEIMYVDCGCCRVHGVSSVEQLFGEWTDRGMLVQLDIFHWIHRFDAAMWTDHHPKYAPFKSALSAVVFAYNKDDIALLVQAIRAGHPTGYANLTDSQIIESHVSKYDLSHYVRRITVGTQETFARVQSAIDIRKGAAGMDENQLHLFKDAAAIDHIWENQQKHIECIQDPPGRNMYTITKYVTRNGVRLPRYSTVRRSNSLEGFHSFLPNMIPGPHCAAVPFQVYLLAGIARWNFRQGVSKCQRPEREKAHGVHISSGTSAEPKVVVTEFDPCEEDVCGPNHLPGYQHVEELRKVLIEIALEEGKLAISDSTRQRVISALNKLDLHDRNIQQFDSLYSALWDNALFGRTNGDPSESSLVQKLKFY
ncbi:hypothetical protein DPX16_17725 [Anabarilius grahami]|uniref:Uncharacterized protein n=1 Tax=Anabarilius grahami TaxID=495550 RepID=A0A3N0YH84_ANAGA|nr:hypothetical protein DPX16_17725 [Anabarilius grahami]